MPDFRVIPSIEAVLVRSAIAAAARRHGRDRVTVAARQAADELRAGFRRHEPRLPESEAAAAEWIEHRIIALLSAELSPSLTRVINATGVVLHTNLGRAPLAPEALARIVEVAAGYTNLEYDLGAGARGHRHVHAERLLTSLTGAEAALVANNTAAATLLGLAAIAAGREVIVSRGELVEIGGGFRVPEVMAQSGAVLREVGTTNRTRVSDYAAAVNDRTALILRVHPSNFRIEGFTERPGLTELADIAHRFSLPLFEDLGSGWLGIEEDEDHTSLLDPLSDEPSIRESLAAGVDLVAASGDKLLGGPQAGLVVGRRDLIDRVRRHPLMRAVRADKLTYAALEATLALWAQGPARSRIPAYRMLTLTAADIDRRARTVIARLSDVPGLTCRIVDGVSTIGGGAAPGSAWPTRLIALRLDNVSADELDRRLRARSPAVVARIHDGDVLLDLRTVLDEEDEALADAINAVGGSA